MFACDLQSGLLTGLGSLGCVIALMCVTHSAKTLHARFGLLCGFALLTGASIGPLLNMAAHVSPQLIPSAFLLTAFNAKGSIDAILATALFVNEATWVADNTFVLRGFAQDDATVAGMFVPIEDEAVFTLEVK